VSKTSCLAALTEVGGSDLAARYAASKKADLAKTCETIFAGKAIVEQDVKEAALAWLPEGMKFIIGASPADPVIPDTVESDPIADPSDCDFGEADSEADELIDDHEPQHACEEAAVAA
jgi:ParB family chromosome partitioning protein